MKHYVMVGFVAGAIVLTGCNKETASTEPATVELDTVEKKVSYIVGYNMANQAKANDFPLDVQAMTLALEDVTAGKEPKLTQEEMQATMVTFQTEQQAKRAEAMNLVAETNLKEGQAFLEANAKKDGVKTTESGLQYKVITEGSGASPAAEDTVQVNYRGTLIDGTEFDSSYKRGEPISFPVSGVIPGWVEALQLMKEGGKWELYIPSELAYGPGGTSGAIGPNATLIFEVELLAINPDKNEQSQDTPES